MSAAARGPGWLPCPAWVALLGLVLTAGALVLAATVNGYYVFVLANVALLATVGVGLNVLLGLTGQVSFGHVGFYALGAYAVAILTGTPGWSFWAAWPVAVAVAGAAGWLLALPALRVKGPYLAMVTIAFGFIVEHGAVEWRGLTGGQNGLFGFASPSLGVLASGERAVAMLAVAAAALALAGFAWLSRGTWGAAMRAVKDSETAAESIGLHPLRVKTVAFALSAALAGLAGGLAAPLSGMVTPGSFSFIQSILFVLVVVVGGAGTVLGPLLGALVVGLLPELLSSLEEYRLLFFGGLLLVVLWVAPQGLIGALRSLVRRPPGAEATDDRAAPPAARLPLSDRVRPALAAQSLGRVFGGVRAVHGLSFEAKPGAITALIGPNGAGKTTALNMLSGFYVPSSGGLTLGAQALGAQPAWRVARAGIARSYQTSQLFGSLSVEDNVALAAGRGRLGPLLGADALRGTDRRARSRALLRACGYSGALGIDAGALPHVDRRVVEIARALATDPDVLLLDEPAAGLSRDDKARLGALLRRVADAGLGVLLVEHDMALVMGISDHVVVLDAGQPLAQGSAAAIQADPSVRAAYLGEGNGQAAGVGQTADVGQAASVWQASDVGQAEGGVNAGSDGAAQNRSEGSPALAATSGTASSPTDAPAPAPHGTTPKTRGAELLHVGALHAGYGPVPVLRGIDLQVRRGEMLAVLGANGAGKSTLMRALAGLHRPVQGGITLAGEDMTGLGAEAVVARGLVLVPEGRQVFPELSVTDNLRLGGFLQPEGLAPRVESMFERFPRLRERQHQRAGLLSGGEQQMLAVARGLMALPEVLLLDEPSLGLAPKVIDDLFQALDRLRGESMTLVLVDQMAGLALSLADRACVIEAGAVVAEGSAQAIADDPALAKAYLGGS